MRSSLAIVTAGLLALPLVAQAKVNQSRGQRELEHGSELMVRQDYADALPQLQRAVRDKPNDPIAHFNLASSLRSVGRYDEAINEYSAALGRVGPSSDESWKGNALYGLAMAHEGKGDHEAAVKAWRDYLAYANRFPQAESGGISVARWHLDGEMRAAGEPGPYPMGTQRAAIPRTRQ